MPRHQLTREEQITGTRKALANPKTPKQFLPSLRERLKQLESPVLTGAKEKRQKQ
jgi:hypothetical protein